MMEKLSPQMMADLNEILDEVETPPLKEGEFTVRMVREARDVTNVIASRLVDKMIKRGDAEFTGMRIVGGHKTKAYKLAKKTKGK